MHTCNKQHPSRGRPCPRCFFRQSDPSGVWRRGEIGKGWDGNTWPQRPHSKHVWNIPSHNLLQTIYCTRNSRKNAIVLRPLRALVSYVTTYELSHELLRRHTTVAAAPLAESTPSPNSRIRNHDVIAQFNMSSFQKHFSALLILAPFLELWRLTSCGCPVHLSWWDVQRGRGCKDKVRIAPLLPHPWGYHVYWSCEAITFPGAQSSNLPCQPKRVVSLLRFPLSHRATEGDFLGHYSNHTSLTESGGNPESVSVHSVL